jgi:hypothetical protein
MRAFRLARIAAEAEGLRLRHRARRTAVRATLALGSLGFLLAAVVFCHVAAWSSLRQHWDQPFAALILAGADVVLAVFLALLAARSSPGRVELEALAVRQHATQSITGTLAFSAMSMELLRIALRFFRRGRG